MDKFIEGLLKVLENRRIHSILLFVSSVFVALSIIYDRYFPETFFTFVYAVGVAYLHLTRLHEVGGKIVAGTPQRLCWYMVIFILWFLSWATAIGLFEIFRSS